MFSPTEDAFLLRLVGDDPSPQWEVIAEQMPDRTARQCRERWLNYLNPAIRVDPWTEAEDSLLIEKVNDLGHFWSTMTNFFNGRSESDIKNRWYSHLKFVCFQDPFTQKWGRASAQTPGVPARKKRRRNKPSPGQAAQRALAEQRPLPPPPREEPVVAKPTVEISDSWDPAMNEQVFDEFGIVDFSFGWAFKNEQ
jgi:hypothetical protein